MSTTPLLSEEEIAQQLQRLPEWERRGQAIAKQYTLASFVDALALVNRVGELAEAANHHPDITINYRRVTFSLSTHDSGGLTRKDFDLARQIEGAASA